MMQAKLDSSEFAYLLHMLGAQMVIGVDNSYLFPADNVVRESLLSQGFDALKKHSWLLPEGRSFKTHTDLVLLIAVMAAPEMVIMSTRVTPAGGKQTITYYLAQSIIVEQLFTSEYQYLLTQLDDFLDINERLRQFLGIPSTTAGWEWNEPICLHAAVFENVMKQAAGDDLSDLKKALQESNMTISDTTHIAEIIKTLYPVSTIEIASLSGEHLKSWRSMVILRAANESVWVMTRNDLTESIDLYPLDSEQLGKLVQDVKGQVTGKPWRSF